MDENIIAEFQRRMTQERVNGNFAYEADGTDILKL